MFIVLVASGIVLFILILFFWTTFNDFVIKRNQVRTDFSDILIQVKRKADLIEKLVSLTKEYATHEKGTFEDVAKARSALDTSKSVKDTAQAENMFTQTLRSLFMVVESNPKLQANENYLALRDDLKTTEDNIAKYREEYNLSVQEYNNTIQTFPNLLSAGVFRFQDEELFEV
jgi:LemA protein